MNVTYAKVPPARSPNFFRLIPHIFFRKLNVEKGPGMWVSPICLEVGHELCHGTVKSVLECDFGVVRRFGDIRGIRSIGDDRVFRQTLASAFMLCPQ